LPAQAGSSQDGLSEAKPIIEIRRKAMGFDGL